MKTSAEISAKIKNGTIKVEVSLNSSRLTDKEAERVVCHILSRVMDESRNIPYLVMDSIDWVK